MGGGVPAECGAGQEGGREVSGQGPGLAARHRAVAMAEPETDEEREEREQEEAEASDEASNPR